MFSKIAFIFVSLLIASPSAFAGSAPKAPLSPEKICKREFANDLIKCVVTAFFQKPKVRVTNLKTCVATAKTEKLTCLTPVGGPSQCEISCTANYDANVFTCQNTFDPSVCDGNVACENFYQQERANCISLEVDALNACNSACP